MAWSSVRSTTASAPRSSTCLRSLVPRMRALLDPGYSARQATYDLRRLRRKRVIPRIPGSHRYQLTQTGRAVAVLFTKAYGRILGPGLAALDPRLPDELATRSPLATARRNLGRELDRSSATGWPQRKRDNLIWPETSS
jgi:hypothetical protein